MEKKSPGRAHSDRGSSRRLEHRQAQNPPQAIRQKRCAQCNREIFGRTRRAKFCSEKCRQRKNMPRKRLRSAEWKLDNPEGVRAHRIVSAAIRRGVIEKRPCAVCGAVSAEAHHWNYLLPLDVEFLCRKHHKEAHRKAQELARAFWPDPRDEACL